MDQTNFVVEYSKSSRTECDVCGLKILLNTIRITIWHMNGSEYYHLQCYQPKLKQYILETDLTIKLKDEEDSIFKAWLNK